MPAMIGIISKLAGGWQLLPACAVPSPAFPTSQVLPETSQLSLPRWVFAPSPLYLFTFLKFPQCLDEKHEAARVHSAFLVCLNTGIPILEKKIAI